MKLGSLFDGSGGFPLAGVMHGIEPVWASEIEPFPIRVTTKRFPNMKHVGNITKLHGYNLEPVDIITFGSPCQDLSAAGARAGLQGERSGLFLEAIRIIKEMRESTDGRYPRYIVWENVYGAFTSNKGEDFRTVLQEIVGIKDKQSVIPRPNGTWNTDGLIMGNDWSIGWRGLDAQYWGVPQRRKRIFLVADFGSRGGVKEILFKSSSLPRNPKKSESEEQGTTEDTGRMSDLSVKPIGLDRACFNQGKNAKYNITVNEELAQTLVAKGPGGGISEKINALCRCDYKGVGNQYVRDYKLLCYRDPRSR